MELQCLVRAETDHADPLDMVRILYVLSIHMLLFEHHRLETSEDFAECLTDDGFRV
jgi:hypothetical protein